MATYIVLVNLTDQGIRNVNVPQREEHGVLKACISTRNGTEIGKYF